jgi:Mg-chelatase subunit ChlD
VPPISEIDPIMSKQDRERLEELRSLAAMAAGEPELEVVLGDEHDCNWSFNWRSRLITANPADILLRSHDFSRGLVLHEAAHARLTRLQDLVPISLMANLAVRNLLNVVEDCRIERWLQWRFPGSKPWIKEYNDELFASILEASAEVQNRDPGGAFLAAILCRWWFGRDPEHLPAASAIALDQAWPHIERAIAAAPPSQCQDLEQTKIYYKAHVVSSCYRATDRTHEPQALEMLARISQYESWEILRDEVLPIFQRLLADTGSPLGRLAELLAVRHGMADPVPGTNGNQPICQVRLSGRNAGLSASRREDRGQGRDQDAYQQARARRSSAIEEIGECLLRHLVTESRMRNRRGFRQGQQLDMRAAMQFEADPALYDRLWMRRTLPTRPDPFFLVLADASGSMEGDRAHATFDALVILREVCLRLEIPLTIILFHNSAQVLQHWSHPEDRKVVPGLCTFRNNPNGGTNMVAGLKLAERILVQSPHRQRHAWVLSDGQPDDFEQARRMLLRIKRQASSLTALGLGEETAALKKLIPGALVNLKAEALSRVAGSLFARMVQSEGGFSDGKCS